MKFLEDKGVGFDVGVTKVPIVASAVIFDLGIGTLKSGLTLRWDMRQPRLLVLQKIGKAV